MANPQCGKDAVRISRELWRELWSGRHAFSPAESRALAYAIDVSWATGDPERWSLPVGQRGKLTFDCSGATLAAAIGLSSDEEGRRVLRRLVDRRIFLLVARDGQRSEYAINKDYDLWLSPLATARGGEGATARGAAGQLPGGKHGNCPGGTESKPAPRKAPLAPTKQRIQSDLQRSSSINVSPPRDPRATRAPVAAPCRPP